MKAGLYPRLALQGMRKNKKFYLPYLLTCAGMVMMYYIMIFLSTSPAIRQIRGGDLVWEIISLGSYVVAFFAAIFLFYTNSFLMRRRKKEFGLYNVLGMVKWNIARILFWETLFLGLAALVIGLAGGLVLSKLAELGLINMVQGEVGFDLTVSFPGIALCCAVFGAIFFLLFLNALRQIKFANALALMQSSQTGERPPKTAAVIGGLIGIGMIAVAYYVAVTIRDPVAALLMFFAAVLLVIAGTYLIMISGSVLFCRLLQKSRKYYYKASHFISVSSMMHRMTRNGAGLASICILATMVLVMISSTASLYFGSEDALHNRYPREINTRITMENWDDDSLALLGDFKQAIDAAADRYGSAKDDLVNYRYMYVAGLLKDGMVETDVSKLNEINADTLNNIYQFYIVPLEDYNAMMGTNESLHDGEALLYNYRSDYQKDTLGFENGGTLTIKKVIDDFAGNGEMAMDIIPSIVLVVNDVYKATEGLDLLATYAGDRMLTLHWQYGFDTGLSAEDQMALAQDVQDAIFNWVHEKQINCSYSSSGRETNRVDFYVMFGGLFYLGILLSIVFIFATVLIIYYKQLSEGYEDQARFEIMQKVGLTKPEIKRSINSQLLTVFFLPLGLAALHMAFAFPIVQKLLSLFNLQNVGLFAATTGICVVIFGLCYALIYRLTAGAYYQIVSSGEED